MAGHDDRFDLGKILLQAQHRWLRPAEVREIILNHELVGLSDEPPNMPPGGSLFLFNRKVLRNFRKDGHNWRKKKDGKTVTEVNEKLKAGNVDVLRCYYARGEENENFRRCIYSMLERDLSHIVLVHYQEVTGSAGGSFEMKNSVSSSLKPSNYQMRSQAMDATSLRNAQASEFEYAEAADVQQIILEAEVQPSINMKNIQQILLEAEHRWLHPAEICEILQNYKKFHISSEPASMPPGGSLFLFDRKVLRYFMKDGHNWRKKKDGRTVKEVYERLKVGSVDVLHSYRAHGADNQNFQRRIYSMLEEDLSHIVLVHYWEVKDTEGVKETEGVPYTQGAEEIARQSEMETSVSSSFNPSSYQMPSQAADATSLGTAQASDFKDAESDTISKRNDSIEGNADQPSATKPLLHGSLIVLKRRDSFIGWLNERLEVDEPQMQSGYGAFWDTVQSENEGYGAFLDTIQSENEVDDSSVPLQVCLDMLGPSLSHDQLSSVIDFSPSWAYENSDIRDTEGVPYSKGAEEIARQSEMDTEGVKETEGVPYSKGAEEIARRSEMETSVSSSFKPSSYQMPSQATAQALDFKDAESDTISKRNDSIEGNTDQPSATKPLLHGSLIVPKRRDSFIGWLNERLEVDEPQMQSGYGAFWDTVQSENEVDDSSVPLQVCLDGYMLGPYLSHDQLISIIDFSPSWAYENSEIKVLIAGKFLKSQHTESCKWSCMFGEVEVPAEVIGDDVLRCYTPMHKAGRVPFYVTCTCRLVCSDVREFEYRVVQTRDVHFKDFYSDCSNEIISMGFRKEKGSELHRFKRFKPEC